MADAFKIYVVPLGSSVGDEQTVVDTAQAQVPFTKTVLPLGDATTGAPAVWAYPTASSLYLYVPSCTACQLLVWFAGEFSSFFMAVCAVPGVAHCD